MLRTINKEYRFKQTQVININIININFHVVKNLHFFGTTVKIELTNDSL